MRRFLAGLAAALIWFGQADAVPAFWSTYPAGGIGYVGSLITSGGNDSDCKASLGHNAHTTSTNVPAGALILVWTSQDFSTSHVTAVNDDVGNIYNKLTGDTDSSFYQVLLWYSFNSTALPAGDSITLTTSTASTPCHFIASAFTGIVLTSPLDQSGAATNTGTTPSLSSGTLNNSLELVAAATWVNGGGSDSFTEAPGFTTDTTLTGSANGLNSAYKIVHSTASTTYAPTLGTSRVWNALMGTFIGTQ